MQGLKAHASYANVMATIAVFVALGGTSYAVTALPRNSVGAKQIRTGAVGKSELRNSAVRSKHINNRSVGLRDIAFAARRSLRGQKGAPGTQGPAGPPGAPLTAAVDSGGGVSRSIGGAVGTHEISGIYQVSFNRDLQGCFAVASLSRVPGGSTTDPPNG
ncbi:MAG: hypothetical protein ACRDK0_14860, partial [Solirubrobacteraceae bacterium]